MADTFRDVVRGEPLVLRADQINGWNQAGRFAQSQRNTTGSDRQINDGRRPEVVRIQNKTGAAIPPATVLKLGDPVVLPAVNENTFTTQINFQGTTPAAVTDLFAIMIDPVTANGIGLGMVVGAAFVEVNVGDASHVYATPYPGQNGYMASANYGPARILWKESGTGIKRCYVLIGGQGPEWVYVFKTTDYTGSAGEHVSYDISGASRTFTFPASPTVGDKLRVGLNAGASPNLLTLDGNGNNVEGGSRTLSDANCYFAWREFRYLGGTVGWSSNSPIT